MNQIDLPINEKHTTESGITIIPTEFSTELYKRFNEKAESDCVVCALQGTDQCAKYACCVEERKDGRTIYFAQI